MGMPYEIATSVTTAVAKAWCNLSAPSRRATRIPYGLDKNQAIIVYEPEKLEHEAAVLYFHGGGYLVGTPQSMGIGADIFCAHGYRFVSVGFGLLPKNKFPLQVTDAFVGVKTAMDYLDCKGSRGCPIVLGGNSAGGHAAMMVAYDTSLQAKYGINASRIKGVISVAGVPDLCGMAQARTAAKVESMRRRYTTFQSVDELAKYSPLQLLDGQTPHVPIFCMHGAFDTVSPIEGERQFVDRLDEVSGEPLGELQILGSRRYQHIRLTAGIFTEDPKKSVVQKLMFDWLSRQGF